uniref:AAA family ATPase n=1 Tax=Bacteroides cellulosilyticus TaxID=246787 RepID=UPI001F01399B
MVEREVIRRIIIEGQEFVNEISLTERPFFFEQKGNYVFVGIRQAGKSYLLYQRIQQLLREEHNINEIVYINPLAELNKRIFKSANRFVVNVVYILK